MAVIDPMRETVGIRQVRHNGVTLPPAMALNITGGTITTGEDDAGRPVYQLDLSGYDAVDAIITALEARVTALENMLNGTTPIADTVTFERIRVRTIEAKGTGFAPDINVPDLQIVALRSGGGEIYDEVFRVVAGDPFAGMPTTVGISFFGGSANPLQTLAPGWVVGDLQARLENYNFVVETA